MLLVVPVGKTPIKQGVDKARRLYVMVPSCLLVGGSSIYREVAVLYAGSLLPYDRVDLVYMRRVFLISGY